MFNFFNELISSYGLNNSFVNSFNIVNMSNKIIYIEGQKGVVFISDNQITINVKNNKINIFGQNLKIKKISDLTIVIYGNIKNIESLK